MVVVCTEDVNSESDRLPVTSPNVQCQPVCQETSGLSIGCSMCCTDLYICYHFNSYFWQFNWVRSVRKLLEIALCRSGNFTGSVLFMMPTKLMVSVFAVLSEVELG